MKDIRVIFSLEAEEVYNFLLNSDSKIEKTILKAINKKVELIKSNIHYGNPISKELIPKEYIQKYEITNLFRVELPNFWRMLYTLTEGETKIEIITFVLDILDHKKYNNLFGYKKKDIILAFFSKLYQIPSQTHLAVRIRTSMGDHILTFLSYPFIHIFTILQINNLHHIRIKH